MPSVVLANEAHVASVAAHMRAADVREIKASSGSTPERALSVSLKVSAKAWTIIDDDGTPIGMFGVAPFMPMTGSPWLLGTDRIENHQLFFLRRSRRYVGEMLAEFPLLMNYVSVHNRTSIEWLRWCGFTLAKFEPTYGVAQQPFYLFSQLRSEQHHV